MDSSLFLSPLNYIDLDSEQESEEGNEFDHFLQNRDGHPQRSLGDDVADAEHFVNKWSKILLRVRKPDRRRRILIALASARENLGSSLNVLNDPRWEDELTRSVHDAEDSGDPYQTFSSMNALAGAYTFRHRFEEAAFLYMRSMGCASVLGVRTMDLLLNRMAELWADQGHRGSTAIALDEMCAAFGVHPLHALIRRARRLASAGEHASLAEEANPKSVPWTCWHIGRAAASDYILGNDDTWKLRLNEGIALATELGDEIWQRSFESFLSQVG